MSDVSQIDGNAVRLRRESQGWALSDLATRACLSVKQVRQIEEGGMTAFYSETVKLTAARKLAGLLEMTEGQLFGQQLAPVENFPHGAHEEDLVAHADTNPDLPKLTGGLNSQHTPFTRSETLHVLAQPPEHIEVDQVEDNPGQSEQPEPEIAPTATKIQAEPTYRESLAVTAPHAETAEPNGAPANGGYFLKILALFVVALAAAALLRPASVEVPPPAPAPEMPVAPAPTMANPADTTLPAQTTAPENKPVDSKPAATEVKSDVNLPKTSETKPAKPLPQAADVQATNPAQPADPSASK